MLESLFSRMKPMEIVSSEGALPGRDTPIRTSELHHVSGRSLQPPYPENSEMIYFGMGCFWGAERKFWTSEDVWVTMVGYGAGTTPNPTYEEVCSGKTGHNEIVGVVYVNEPGRLERVLEIFWESHDPTQGMRQGNDRGTQYRSGIYTTNQEQLEQAKQSREQFQAILDQHKMGQITTEVKEINDFYYAEDYHQQYLSKNPGGYCGLGGLKF